MQIGHTNILIHTLASLLEIGIEEVIVATGHCHEKIGDCVAQQFDGDGIRLVHNPDYLKGSGSSLKRAINEMDGAALILEADLICHVDILRRFVLGPASNAIAMGDYGHDRIEGRVELSDESFDRLPCAALGGPDRLGRHHETIRPRSREYSRVAQCEATRWRKRWLSILGSHFMAGTQHDFVGIGIDDLPWIEVDTEEDLIRARAIIYPKLYPGSVHG